MNKRIAANLAFFAIITALLLVWAVNNVISLDAVKHPYKVSATFVQAPGLFTGTQVTYLGHSIGTVGGVKLLKQSVVVTLKVDHGVKIPQALSASVLRQSAVGEPYVDLAPLPGTDAKSGRQLAKGDHIPIEHTSTPLAYSDLFKAVSDLVGSIPPKDLNTAVHELAVGLDGRADSIRQILTGADQLTSDFAAHSAELDATLTALTQFTHTMASQTGALASSVDNVAALAAQLHQSEQTIATVLDTGPGFAGRVADVIAASKGSLGCVFDGLGGLMARLNDPAMAAGLGQSIASGPQLVIIQKDVTDQQPDGPYQKGNFLFNFGSKTPVPQYPHELSLPGVPVVPACPAAAPASGAGPASAVAASGAGVGAPNNSGPNAARPSHRGPAAAGPSSSKPGTGGGLPGWMKKAVLLLLALLILIGLLKAGRRWLWPPTPPPGESDAAGPTEHATTAATGSAAKDLGKGHDDGYDGD